MKRLCKIIAVVLVVALLFTGCSGVGFQQWLQSIFGLQMIPFSEMEYSRPDMGQFRDQLNACLEGAKSDTRAKTLMDKVFALYDTYHLFHTNYTLANIYFYKDLTDIYWSEEYTYCLENASEVDAGMDQLLYALAGSSLKEELEAEEYFGDNFFDAYTGESLWDETFTELMNQEMKLQNEYDALSAKALDVIYGSKEFYEGVGLQMEELLVKLVGVRQEIARHAGYPSYLEFAYDFYYNRDYTPQQAIGYMADVRDELSQIYVDLPGSAWTALYKSWTEKQMFSYVESIANNMGGIVSEAFTLMQDGGYYDITYSPNKYNASFETFLQYYYVPFIFVNPQGTGNDPLSFTHEFGHFCNDYAATGTSCGIDVAEIFSQGLEYLSIYYADGGTQFREALMANSLSVFVEQSVYASFEHELYLMEDVTVDAVRDLYGDIAESYHLDELGYDNREYVGISHLYIAPMYMLSYVLSNDLAMQIYQAEEASSGAGKALLENNLATEEVTLMAFATSAGLKNPFEAGRVAQLRETFEKVFG